MTETRMLQTRGFDCNVFFLKDPASNAFDLVDAGIGVNHALLVQQVAAVIDPHRIRRVAVTHEHLDHVNGLPHWQKLGAKVVASPACAAKLAAGHDPTSAMFGQDIPRLLVDEEVGDGDHVNLGGRDHEVLLTPGHSPGSCCYWEPRQGTLFAGDTAFADGGIGRFDFPDGNVRLLAESMLRLEKLPVRMLHCGHGPSPQGDEAARSLRGSVAHVQACL